jgi:nicotinamidase-related amidase
VSAVRDPPADHLLTQQNAALIVIDYQPSQIAAVRSMDRPGAQEYRVDAEDGEGIWNADCAFHCQRRIRPRQADRPQVAEVLEDNPPIDRTTLNAWEDADFLSVGVRPGDAS